MAEASTHPLLSLPDDEIIEKLREMNMEEILKFSLISERCKGLVKSIKIGGIEGTSISVYIGSDIVVIIETGSKTIFLTYYQEPNMYWGMGAYGRKKKLTTPQSVLVEVGADETEDTVSEWKTIDFAMKNWLEHLQIIFDNHKIDSIVFSNDSSQFDMDDIKESFGNTAEVHIWDTGCVAFNQLILQKFSPLVKLIIRTSNFPNSKIPESILIQNFDDLVIGNDFETTSMTLDELLLINSKKTRIENLQITPKQLNKFIKLWQHGSNPHMEYLSIGCSDVKEDDKEIIMKGIAAIPADGDMASAMDIFRMDGVKATIQFDFDETSSIVEMFVWYDHCVKE